MHSVYLNHLLVFVDRDTYRALSASEFLNEHFACSEERTTHDQATGMSWTGRYYYGRQTYFEFMNPEKTSWAPRDGLAFGIESEGGSEELARRLKQATEVEVRRYRRNRRYRDQDIPWFWSVEVPRADDARLISWVMEYDPGFLDHWAPDLPPGKTGLSLGKADLPSGKTDLPPGKMDTGTAGIARNRFLARYRSAIGDNLANRLFRDITSVTVSLPPDEADLLEAELGIFGYTREEAGHEASVSWDGSKKAKTGDRGLGKNDETGDEPTASPERKKFRGPDLEIVVERILPDEDRDGSGQIGVGGGIDRIGGISAFIMETRPVSVTTTHTFGPACRLTIRENGEAVWSFRKIDQY